VREQGIRGDEARPLGILHTLRETDTRSYRDRGSLEQRCVRRWPCQGQGSGRCPWSRSMIRGHREREAPIEKALEGMSGASRHGVVESVGHPTPGPRRPGGQRSALRRSFVPAHDLAAMVPLVGTFEQGSGASPPPERRSTLATAAPGA
jgi:hypothetical protein